MSRAKTHLVATLLAIVSAGTVCAADSAFEWEAGSVFKEHTFLPNGVRPDDGKPRAHLSEIDPGTKREGKEKQIRAARVPRIVELDPTGATRAEFFMEYWNGHAGTTAMYRLNRKTWNYIPRPLGTPREPERYYHTLLGNRVVPLNLATLRKGPNEFAFTAGPQIEGGFDWGFFWIYSFTTRIYYPRAAEHPSVRIANVRSGNALTDNPEIRVEPKAGGAEIQRVDVYAFYEDFNYSGSGLHREWHAQSEYGKPKFHVGTATQAPWLVKWDTTWVPDQDKPMRLVARVVDAAGWHSVSEIVGDLSLRRDKRHVVMCPALDVPTLWGVRVGAEKGCGFEVPPPTGKLVSAKLKVMSWSGNHADIFSFNGVQFPAQIGRSHDYQVDMIDVPVAQVKTGRNTFSVKSTSTEHPAEIDWPGPVLLLEYME